MSNKLKFNSRLTFLKGDSEETDSGGYGNDGFSDYYSCFCEVFTLQGREYYEAAAVQAESNIRFVIRFTKKELDSDMRVRFKGRIFEIVAPIINDGYKNETMTVICREVI